MPDLAPELHGHDNDLRSLAAEVRALAVQVARLDGQVGEIHEAVLSDRAETTRLRERCWTLAEQALQALRDVVTVGPSWRFLALIALLLVGIGALTVGDLGELWRAVSPWASADVGPAVADGGPASEEVIP